MSLSFLSRVRNYRHPNSRTLFCQQSITPWRPARLLSCARTTNPFLLIGLARAAQVIRKNSAALTAYDVEDMYDVRDTAVHVLLEVLKVKALRAQLLEPLMHEIVAIAQSFRAQHGAPQR
jgi:hypothetical protein